MIQWSTCIDGGSTSGSISVLASAADGVQKIEEHLGALRAHGPPCHPLGEVSNQFRIRHACV